MSKTLKYGIINLIAVAAHVGITLLLISALKSFGNETVFKVGRAVLWAIHIVIDLVILCFYLWFVQCEKWVNRPKKNKRGKGGGDGILPF
ncbi:MAG: hypothetical protein IJS65_06105 [Clostridia bacterium]|nr:hypothetical protein [Clostridia bacterium]